MGEQYCSMLELRGIAAIPNNQTVAIRIHDIKLSEGIIIFSVY